MRVAHEETFNQLTGRIFRACAARHDWPAKLTGAVRAAIEFALESPEEAQLLLYETLGADRELTERALASNEHLVGLLRAGREYSPQAAMLPELTERADRLPSIAPELVQMTLIPYVGTEEARRLAASAA